MPVIRYNKQSYVSSDDETLLDTLLKNKVNFPHSCKIGTCQSCLTKLLDGETPKEAQQGLNANLIARNYFLACQCRPTSNMSIALPEQCDSAVSAKITALTKLNHNVLQLKLHVGNKVAFTAGQYINLITANNIIRSYSIARAENEHVELHVKLMPNGLMSTWLQQQAKINTSVHVRGPMGNCFYHNPKKNAFSLVLAGTGTGLAPLIGIANDALKNKHKGKIILIHGGVCKDDLYLHAKLNQIAQTHVQLTYVACTLNASQGIRHAPIDNVLLEKLNSLNKSNMQLYICGPAETTNALKTKAFLSGVPSSAIYSDSFIIAEK
jgi:NAD(P)H-flavin reductase/ferredoxin